MITPLPRGRCAHRWTGPHSARYRDGADFTLTRTHIGSCDFSVEGKVFYADYLVRYLDAYADAGGIADPDGFQEADWFGNDAFWWHPHATDWAYTAEWAGPGAADHPMSTPVHRYARDLIVSLDHWVSGWVDWNIVLDRHGGPNHVGNFCGAPILIDTATGEIHYTPVFHVLSQFSRTIRPGDQAVRTRLERAGPGPDALHACATLNGERLLSVQLLNTTGEVIRYNLQVAGRYAELTIPANSVQTVRVGL